MPPESRCGAVDDRPAANPCGPPIDTRSARSAQGARWERNAYYPTRHVSLPATACVSGPATQHLRSTTTSSGLSVKAYLAPNDYANGEQISDESMAKLILKPHETQPTRNYTLHAR